MMPNTIDLYAGMVPDLSETPDFWSQDEGQLPKRRSEGRIARLGRLAARLLSILL